MKKLRSNLLLYWFEGFWILFFTYNALWSAFVVSASHFPQLTSWEKFLIIGGVLNSWCLTMMALMVTLIRKATKGQPLIGGDEGNTTIIRKDETINTGP